MEAAREVDPTFLTLPLARLAQVALERARDFGVTHADFRLERNRHQYFSVRDGALEGAQDGEDLGFAVRVVLDATWVSAYAVNPFEVPLAEKTDLFTGWTHELLAAEGVAHASGSLYQVQENKYYADLAGSSITQQRVRVEPFLEVHGTNAKTGAFDSMRTIAPPVGRGWEYLAGDDFDFDAERALLPELLREKLAAPSVEAGAYDLVIHPSNLWLTIHESIGHATELDRALGYEANYAGTSFATYD